MAEEQPNPGRFVRDWWSIVIAILSAVAIGAITYANARAELVTLHDKAVSLEVAQNDNQRTASTEFRTLTRRMERLERKVDLLLCAADRTRCGASLLADPPSEH